MNKIAGILLTVAMVLLPGCKPGDADADTASGPVSPVDPQPAPDSLAAAAAVEFAMAMAPGWNLGNNLDAVVNGVSSETCWGNGRCSQATMDSLRAYGFNSVRIPVSWVGHIGAAPTYTIQDSWMNRVEEVVGYARNAGLKVIINIHHDGNPEVAGANYWLNMRKAVADTAYNRQVQLEIAAVWTQIATRFANEGDYLVFEDLNEITDGASYSGTKSEQMKIMNQWNQTFVNAVRSAGGNNATRYLGIASFYARCDLAVRYLTIPTDRVAHRILVSVHSYDPWAFAGAGSDTTWGHTGRQNIYGESVVVERVQSLYDTFVGRGYPVYIGEGGAVNRADSLEQAYQRYYMEYYARAAYTRHIPFFLWDNGTNGKTGEEAFGYINHHTGEHINRSRAFIQAFVRAQTDTASDYTLRSIYQRAPNNN